MRRHRPVALIAGAALLLGACDDGGPGEQRPPGEVPTPSPSPPATGDGDGEDDLPREVPDGEEEAAGGEDDGEDDRPVEWSVSEVATGLEAPWDVVEHDGRVLVTERDRGRLLEVGDDGAATEVRTFDIDPAGEGGLLGLASDGDALFVHYTGGDGNRVVRLDDVDDGDEIPLVTGIPKGPTHNGGRLAIGPDDLLYVGTGDAGDPGLAADPGSLAGKILRVDRDGEVPDDNPYDGSPVYSLGHRNVQGLAFDAEGRLWAAELGPDRDDEINLIEAGADYGWPEVTGAPGVDGLVDAAFVAQPAEASWSGATIPDGGAIPQWEGNLLVTGLRGQQLWRLELDGGRVASSETLLTGQYGRLRTARVAPDGAIWLLTSNRDGRGSPASNDDRLLRVGP